MMAFKSELPWLLMAATVVRIEDLGERPPVIEVLSAPAGYNIYVGPLVNNSNVEHGALINLLGIDQQSLVPESGWRFVDPNLPEGTTRNGLDVLWITHDRSGPFSNGDLQIGFNTILPGHHYANPIHTQDKSLGPVTNQWITVYQDDVVVLLFKPR